MKNTLTHKGKIAVMLFELCYIDIQNLAHPQIASALLKDIHDNVIFSERLSSVASHFNDVIDGLRNHGTPSSSAGTVISIHDLT